MNANLLADGNFDQMRPVDTATRFGVGTPLLSPSPVAGKRRLGWKWVTFILMVTLPTVLAAIYLFGFSSDQYVSEFRFRLRHAQPSKLDMSSPALSGLTGASVALDTITDSEIVTEYLRSRQLLDDIGHSVDIEKIYGKFSADWYARLSANRPIEQKLEYWRHMVDPFFDNSTGIVTVKVRAFNPEDAKLVSSSVLNAAEQLVNELSERASADKLAFTKKSVAEKALAWRNAEVALREFRNTNDVMFPTMQANESTEIDSNLRAGEAKARAALSTLRMQGVSSQAPQSQALQAQISSLEAEIRRGQLRVTHNDTLADAPKNGQSLASLMATYDGLDVDTKITSKSYEMAIMAEQAAQEEVSQQHIYLDAFVKPAIPQESTYPLRWRSVLQVAVASFVVWCLSMLLWRAVMDHLD